MKSSSNGFCFFCRNSIPFLTPTGVDYFLIYWLYYLAEGDRKLTPFRLGDSALRTSFIPRNGAHSNGETNPNAMVTRYKR